MLNGKVKFMLMLTIGLVIMGIGGIAFADDAPANAQTVEAATASSKAWIAIAAGLCISLAAFGGAISQARAGATALEGIARNPGAADKLFTPMILALALIESLVIYALIISFLIVGNI